MKYKVFLIWVSLFFIVFFRANAQSEADFKYLTVFSYLKTDERINEELKRAFRFKKKRNQRFVEFNVMNRVDFLDVSLFLNNSDFMESLEEGMNINDNKEFRATYAFESYYSQFLLEMFPTNNSELYLTFSQSFGNYLIVEFTMIKPVSPKHKLGLGFQVLFKFKENMTVESVAYAASMYN
jgi:hypothetical protein